jgi:FMN phosphatase YigB (HAD superfamily)
MIQCVLFDFFGTLVNYVSDREALNFKRTHQFLNDSRIALSYAAFQHGWEAAFDHWDGWSASTGCEFSMRDVAGSFLDGIDENRTSELDVDELVGLYIEEWSLGIEPIAGVDTFLAMLSERCSLGLITNTHYAPMVYQQLTLMGCREAFTTVTTSVEFGKPKPHREIFDATLDALGFESKHSVFVGDSYSDDYVGARRADMDCYLIGRQARVPAQWQIPSVLDLPLHVLSK